MTLAATTSQTFKFTNPAGLYDPVPNGYSHLAVIEAPVRLVLLAGQGGQDGEAKLSADFRAQVRQAFSNVRIGLAAAGASASDVVKLIVLVVDHTEAKLAIFGEELEAAFGAGMKPTCTLIPVPRLALDGMLIEIEATAALPG